LKYIAKVTKKVVEHVVENERIVVTDDEYDSLLNIFAQALKYKDVSGVHINQITIYGGYKIIPQDVTLDIEIK